MRLTEKRTFFAGIGLVLMLVALSPVAFGHAMLIRSQPAAKAKLKEAPKTVELWFSEELQAGVSTIAVTDESGMRVDRNDSTVADGNKKLQVSLEDLQPGTYTVDWKALSTDEHTMKGKFAFTVVANPAATPTPQALRTVATTTPSASPEPSMASETSSTQESTSTWAQSLVRWLLYLGMMTLFGGFAFYLFVLSPVFQHAAFSSNASVDQAARLSVRRTLFLSWVSIALILGASVIALVQQASSVFDKTIPEALSPTVLADVLAKTGYGRAWFLQVAATAAFLIIVLLLSVRTKRATAGSGKALWWIGLLLGLVLLVAPSWTGHAAAAIKDFRLAVITDWLHIVAGAFWVGGLFHLGLSALPGLSHLDSSARIRAVSQLIRRFTRIAIPSVILLVLAGLYNTWVHVESFQAFWSTTYGRTLLLKLLLVGIMLVLGGLNNFHFGKKATRLSESDFEKLNVLERGFGRSVFVEGAIGVAVLLVTAILVFLTPARSHPQMALNKTNSTSIEERR